MKFFRSLATRLIGTTVAVVAAASLAIGVYQVTTERELIEEQLAFSGRLLTKAATIAALEPLIVQDIPVLETITSRLTQGDRNIAFIRILDEQGQVLSSYAKGESGHGEVEVFSSPIQVQTNPPEVFGSVELGVLREHFDALIFERIVALLGVNVLSFCLLVLILVSVIRRVVTNRLGDLANQAQAIGRGNLALQISVSGDDELAQLGQVLEVSRQGIVASYEELAREREKLTTIIRASHEGIIATNKAGEVVMVNRMATDLLARSQAEIQLEGLDAVWRHLQSKAVEVEERVQASSCTCWENGRHISVRLDAIHDADGQLIGRALLLRDVSAERRLEENLREIAMKDALSGLFNRRQYDQDIEMEFAHAKQENHALAVLMLDIDHFKALNDSQGHDMGDRVIQQLGGLLNASFRQSDRAYRYGGEEFVLILPRVDQALAIKMAEQLRRAVAELDVDGVKVTVSIGVAVYPAIAAADAAELLKAADVAMYQAKRSGRNRCSLAGAQPHESATQFSFEEAP